MFGKYSERLGPIILYNYDDIDALVLSFVNINVVAESNLNGNIS